MQKCKHLYVEKAQTKFFRRLNYCKNAHKFFKSKKGNLRSYLRNILYKMINNQCSNNAELIKREIYWQHRLKTFFLIGLTERGLCWL